MKSYNDFALVAGLVVVGLFAGFFGRLAEKAGTLAFSPAAQLNSAAAILATEQNIVQSVPPEITLGFVGDIMLDRGVKKKVSTVFGGDYTKLFTGAEFLTEPDIMFANLEGPVSDTGTDRHNLYSFRMDPKVLPILKDAGIDVVSFANNHIGDWGRPAFEDSLSRIRASGILPCGAGMNKAEASAPVILSENGYTVGFLCFSDVGPNDMAATEDRSGILLASDPEFDAVIHSASQKVNALIVSFHWGEEYETAHNARQEELAKRAIDAGAVMVAGHHPHVAQDIGEHSGAPIIYSLGNFIFDQYFSAETMRGLYVTATLSGKTISDLSPHIVRISKNSAPTLEK